MNSIQRGYALVKSSRQVFKINPMLGLYPLAFSFAMMIIMALAIFAFTVLVPESRVAALAGADPSLVVKAASLGGFIILFFVLTTLSIFWSAAFYVMADAAIEGRRMGLREAARNAWMHRRAIGQWAIFATTVGLAIQLLDQNLGIAGKILGFISRVAWSLIIVFAIPVLVRHDLGPIETAKYSADLFKRTWGENLTAEVTMSFFLILIIAALVVAGIALAFVGAAGIAPIGAVLVGAVALFMLLMTACIYFSAIQQIFQACLYRYAETGDFIGPFSPELIQGAFKQKTGIRRFIG